MNLKYFLSIAALFISLAACQSDRDAIPTPAVSDPLRQARLTAAQQTQFLMEINKRRANGCTCYESNGKLSVMPAVGSLVMNLSLMTAAEERAQDLIAFDLYSQPTIDETPLQTRLAKAGYRGKDVAETTYTSNVDLEAQFIVDSWMRSNEGCKNIMKASFTNVGIGSAINPKNRFLKYSWVADFGGR